MVDCICASAISYLNLYLLLLKLELGDKEQKIVLCLLQQGTYTSKESLSGLYDTWLVIFVKIIFIMRPPAKLHECH